MTIFRPELHVAYCPRLKWPKANVRDEGTKEGKHTLTCPCSLLHPFSLQELVQTLLKPEVVSYIQ